MFGLTTKARPDTRLTLIHDRCDYDVEILARFNELKSDPGFKQSYFFTTCAPMGWEDCTPLQTADLFAYENMKDAEGRLENRKMRKSFDLILTEGNTGIRNLYMDTNSIETMKPFIDGMGLPVGKKARKQGMGDGRYQQFKAALDTIQRANGSSSCPVDLQKRARYLQSIACLVKDVAKHDELQQQAQELLRKAKAISIEA